MKLLLSLAAVGAILASVTLAGALVAAAFVPRGSLFRPERWGWSFLFGAGLVSIETAAALALGLPVGWATFLIAAALAAAAALKLRLRGIGSDAAPAGMRSIGIAWLLGLTLASGVALYALRALTEPMWSNDYLSIWGLKGKTIFAACAFPSRVWPPGLYGFAHPEYPLGLPLSYAGLASLLGRWDDQALALLFPCLQIATLAVLFGWLRRRGLPWPIPIAAAALLSQFEPLYSGFLTGMAEVPLSCAFLLFGTALSDSLDPTDPPRSAAGADSGAERRLAAASLLVAATKNEGLFLAAAGAVAALLARRPARLRAAACAFLPAVAVAGITRLASGNAPLRDFDFAFLGPRLTELPARLATAARAELVDVFLPAWPGLICVAALLIAGRRSPFADRLLWLAAACLLAYLFLPALAVLGPTWLVRTTLARTAAALAPLVAAGVAGRLGNLRSGDPVIA